jgi:hypothetical protein
MSSKRIKRNGSNGHSRFVGEWNGQDYLVNGVSQPDVAKRLLSLTRRIAELPGHGRRWTPSFGQKIGRP